MRIILLILLLLSACSKKMSSPEGALEEFIELRMGKVSTREFIAERVTGNMKEALNKMTEAEFIKFADLRSSEQDNFKITEKKCDDQVKTCLLTYTINFSTKQEAKQIFTSEVMKIAELQWSEGKWLIAAVSNVKTTHESLEPIFPLE